MRRVLVVSDSHDMDENVQKAIDKAGKIDLMIHLGDMGYDCRKIEHMAGVPTYLVAGNNDYDSFLKDKCIIYIGSHKCLLVHGHRQNVHYGVDRVRYLALENECDIAMYGHTHVPFLEEDPNGVTILNPGSLTFPRQSGRDRTFLIMEIDEDENITYKFDHI